MEEGKKNGPGRDQLPSPNTIDPKVSIIEDPLLVKLTTCPDEPEARRIVRPIIAEALRRSGSLQLENQYYDDATNAEIFRDLFGGFAANVPGSGWRVYDIERGKWLIDYDKIFVRHFAVLVGILRRKAVGLAEDQKKAVKFAEYTLSAQGVRSMLTLAECDPRLVIMREAFDLELDAILDAAGNFINLCTGEVRRALAEDRFTRSLGVAYDPAATYPTFDRFILEVMSGDGEAVAFLKRWNGYSFTGRTTEQKSLTNVGGGRNGKGTYSNVAEYIAGDYAKTIKAETFAPDKGQGPAYEIAELPGVRMVLIKETQKGAWLNESLLKVSAGEDMLPARRPYERPFSFRPQFKLWIETNDAPRIRSRGLAIWRRILRLDWTFTPEHEDQQLGAKLRAEAPGILNWILAGAQEWYAEGLGMPRRVAEAIAAYKDKTDLLADFLAGFARGPNLTAPSGELYARYKAWAQESGAGTLSAAKFKDELEERGITYQRTPHARFFKGISLLPPSDPQIEGVKQNEPETVAPSDQLDFGKTEPAREDAPINDSSLVILETSVAKTNDSPPVISITSPIARAYRESMENDSSPVIESPDSPTPSSSSIPDPDQNVREIAARILRDFPTQSQPPDAVALLQRVAEGSAPITQPIREFIEIARKECSL